MANVETANELPVHAATDRVAPGAVPEHQALNLLSIMESGNKLPATTKTDASEQSPFFTNRDGSGNITVDGMRYSDGAVDIDYRAGTGADLLVHNGPNGQFEYARRTTPNSDGGYNQEVYDHNRNLVETSVSNRAGDKTTRTVDPRFPGGYVETTSLMGGKVTSSADVPTRFSQFDFRDAAPLLLSPDMPGGEIRLGKIHDSKMEFPLKKHDILPHIELH